jgi:epsilon-lactone hydrolase
MNTANKQQKGIIDPERIIPPPVTVSAHAQAFLSQKLPVSPTPQPTDLSDKAAWKSFIAESNGWLTLAMQQAASAMPMEIATLTVADRPVYEVTPAQIAAGYEDAAILYLHGGAYIHGEGMAGAYMAGPLACTAGMKTYSVDYRMPPDHPFPAALEDAVAAYRWLIERVATSRIAIAGGSAGGGLSAALVLKIRDLGLPLPGACVLATPEADLTEAGDSLHVNKYADVVTAAGGSLSDSIALYANGHDLRDPYLSPVYGDFTKGYAPTILTCGTRDILLSDTVRMHRALLKAGIPAELHVWEAMPHGGFFGAPEDQEVFVEQARFIREWLGKAS